MTHVSASVTGTLSLTYTDKVTATQSYTMHSGPGRGLGQHLLMANVSAKTYLSVGTSATNSDIRPRPSSSRSDHGDPESGTLATSAATAWIPNRVRTHVGPHMGP